jgi:Transposase DDE domain
MTTIPKLARTLQNLFTTTADDLAHATGFIQRKRQWTGATFAQTLVFGWLDQPQASLGELAQTAAALGVTISPQGLDQRFTDTAAEFLHQLLQAGVETLITATPVAIPLLRRFTEVTLLDSSTIGLPEALATLWPGKGSSDPQAGNAAVKLTVGLNLVTGRLRGPELQAGRQPDTQAPLAAAALPPGSLRLADLGYFDLKRMAELARQGASWLSRLKSGTKVRTEDGKRWDSVVALLEAQGRDRVELSIRLGLAQRLPCRLLAERVPPEVAEVRRRRLRDDAQRQRRRLSAETLALAAWTVLVTNAPAELLSLSEALTLRRVRWQIELLFKLWKSHGEIDTSRSVNPQRVLCEVYAKLLAMLVQHWVTLVGRGSEPARSATKAAQTIRQHALGLAVVLRRFGRLCEVLRLVVACLGAGCRMNRRKTCPNTYQLLLDVTTGGLT